MCFSCLSPKYVYMMTATCKKVSHRSFWNLCFFCNIVSNIQLYFLQAGYLTTVGWKGGARGRKEGSDRWEVQIISSWSFATCGGPGSLTYMVEPWNCCFYWSKWLHISNFICCNILGNSEHLCSSYSFI